MGDRGATVLIVDDEQPLVSIIQTLLEDEGCTVFTANDGAAAFEIATRELPALIITDLMMPRLDGRELAGRLAEDSRTARTPIMMMTIAYRPQPGDTFADVIAKPFAVDELLDKLRPYLQ